MFVKVLFCGVYYAQCETKVWVSLEFTQTHVKALSLQGKRVQMFCGGENKHVTHSPAVSDMLCLG